MRRLIKLVALTAIILPALSVAQDKQEPTPRSLAEEAAYLTEKGGKPGWVSEEVALTRDGGKESFKGQLTIAFAARKATPTGLITLGWRSGKMNGAVGNVWFEVVEKGGKRFIHVKDVTGREVVLALEYSVAYDVLTVKGAINKAWTATFDEDRPKAIAFRPRN